MCFPEQNLICVESGTIELSDCSKTLLLSPCRENIVQPAFHDQYEGDVDAESLCGRQGVPFVRIQMLWECIDEKSACDSCVYMRFLKFFTEESTTHCVIVKSAECL